MEDRIQIEGYSKEQVLKESLSKFCYPLKKCIQECLDKGILLKLEDLQRFDAGRYSFDATDRLVNDYINYPLEETMKLLLQSLNNDIKCYENIEIDTNVI
jgi:hypothetical protein